MNHYTKLLLFSFLFFKTEKHSITSGAAPPSSKCFNPSRSAVDAFFGKAPGLRGCSDICMGSVHKALLLEQRRVQWFWNQTHIDSHRGPHAFIKYLSVWNSEEGSCCPYKKTKKNLQLPRGQGSQWKMCLSSESSSSASLLLMLMLPVWLSANQHLKSMWFSTNCDYQHHEFTFDKSRQLGELSHWIISTGTLAISCHGQLTRVNRAGKQERTDVHDNHKIIE